MKSSAETIAGAHISEHLTQEYTKRAKRVFSDADTLSRVSSKLKNVMSDKSQGNMFEHLEVMKFNYDALKKDSDLFAQTTASMGLYTDPVDIVIKKGQKTLREVQAKSSNTAARSVFALSQKKYDEMARLAPSDQIEMVEKLLDQRISKGTLKVADYEQTKRNLLKTLEHCDVQSSGTTYKEAVSATDPTKVEDIANNYKKKATLSDMHQSGKQAGKVGASIAGGISALSGGYSLYKGEKDVGEVLANVAVNSAKGYAVGYVTTALSKGITHTASQHLTTSTAKALVKFNAPVAIAAGVVTASTSIINYLNGDIESEQLLSEISHTAVTGTSSFYYGALGQVAIPIPVVGALVGSMAGYCIGNLLNQSGLIALGDSRVVKEAKSRRKNIEAMCLNLISEANRQREELEKNLDKYFSDRSKIFTQSFNQMDDALLTWNPNLFVLSLEQINNQFGRTLQFKTFEDFDDFMESDEAFEF